MEDHETPEDLKDPTYNGRSASKIERRTRLEDEIDEACEWLEDEPPIHKVVESFYKRFLQLNVNLRAAIGWKTEILKQKGCRFRFGDFEIGGPQKKASLCELREKFKGLRFPDMVFLAHDMHSDSEFPTIIPDISSPDLSLSSQIPPPDQKLTRQLHVSPDQHYTCFAPLIDKVKAKDEGDEVLNFVYGLHLLIGYVACACDTCASRLGVYHHYGNKIGRLLCLDNCLSQRGLFDESVALKLSTLSSEAPGQDHWEHQQGWAKEDTGARFRRVEKEKGGEEDDERCGDGDDRQGETDKEQRSRRTTGPGEHDGLEDEESDYDSSDDRLDAYIIEERIAKEEAETVEAVIDQYMERFKKEYVLVSLGGFGSVVGEVRGREREDG
ncbi:hypothetical protein L198_04524 [Cryptococcus wingfieldii CBS 7118]|uniref:Uncharacterized protein n=1 Tax=Cryptococcus wingfieldii CBS 7118 TaxID=1295528 RepID=A0A1E3J5I7_9TREE|nr:hypothetical protein L198_04524 [Cryptococcus wingfieldii CBS 7118]ODN95905.1 hypothetical protein L198_04524 [Cryptococcus wingfieldii CBS 7118]